MKFWWLFSKKIEIPMCFYSCLCLPSYLLSNKMHLFDLYFIIYRCISFRPFLHHFCIVWSHSNSVWLKTSDYFSKHLLIFISFFISLHTLTIPYGLFTNSLIILVAVLNTFYLILSLRLALVNLFLTASYLAW